MSEQAVINTIAFAQAGETRKGLIAISELQRLGDRFSHNRGTIRYVARGSINQDGDPVISLDITATVALVCQRCLEPLQADLQISKSLRMVPDEISLGNIFEEDENIETLVAAHKMDILNLVEDEIILWIPIAPSHDDCERVHGLEAAAPSISVTNSPQ